MFPRTEIGGLSVSRMIVGINWFMGYSHTSLAKDAFIRDFVMNPKSIADIIEVYLRAGIDTILGPLTTAPLPDAVREAEDRVGRAMIRISTPIFPVDASTPSEGFDQDAVARILDTEARHGVHVCMPHQATTDALVDRCTRSIRRLSELTVPMRERGLVPGLSTHMPESIVYADACGDDVETYILIYNAMGFLMQLEADWVARIIRDAHKPVVTIKPMAAGQIRPFQALPFVWTTIRPQDMVCVGSMTPDEARELIDLSLNILENRDNTLGLQETRSKASVKG
jgi:hypothetical protein